MNRKYYAQILLEVELEVNSNFAAWDEAERFQREVLGIVDGDERTKVISTNIVSDPSDEEFLESLCVK